MSRRIRAALCPLVLVGLAVVGCSPSPSIETAPPSPTAAPTSSTPTAWNGFAAAENLCARLDWTRLKAIDSTPTLTGGSWTQGDGVRGTDCNPRVESSRFKGDVGSVLVRVRLHDTAELAELSLADAGYEFTGKWVIELSPWTQSRLYKNGTDIQFVGRAENLNVHVGITLGVDLAGVYDEEEVAEIVLGLAQDAYDLCRT